MARNILLLLIGAGTGLLAAGKIFSLLREIRTGDQTVSLTVKGLMLGLIGLLLISVPYFVYGLIDKQVSMAISTLFYILIVIVVLLDRAS